VSDGDGLVCVLFFVPLLYQTSYAYAINLSSHDLMTIATVKIDGRIKSFDLSCAVCILHSSLPTHGVNSSKEHSGNPCPRCLYSTLELVVVVL
jgi:hypothetical protein